MSSPSHPQSPGVPTGPAQHSTAEIPVVQPAAPPVTKHLPPHPGATAFGAHPATAVEAPQPTGPVDFVPGLPGLGTPPPPPPALVQSAPPTPGPTWPETLENDGDADDRAGARTRAARLPQDRSALVAVGLAVLALVLLELGLALDFDTVSLWELTPLWSAFATAAVVVGLVALLVASSPGGRARAGLAWRVGAAGLLGLAVFWLLVVLPGADSDRGFLLTAALGCLGAALWVGAKRA